MSRKRSHRAIELEIPAKESSTAGAPAPFPRWLATRVAPVLLIGLAGFLAYVNTFNVPFLFDDILHIPENEGIKSTWPGDYLNSSRPVVEYSFAVNFALHGLELWGYHALNLAIHVAAGLCLYGIASRTFARLGGSLGEYHHLAGLGVALLWVVHPLQTQAVTYIIQRHESLMGLFFLATLYCFIRGRESPEPSGWYALSLMTCALGMGCKQVMVAAPLIVLWYDRAFFSSSWRELWSRGKFYYAGLFASWGVLAWTMRGIVATAQAEVAAGTSGDVIVVKGLNSWNYLLSQAGVITHYLRLSFWPSGQCLDYGPWPVAQTPLDIWPQGLLIVGLVAATVWAIFRRPKLSFLGGWFFLILAPTSSVLPIVDLVFEHRMYLPLAAVIAAAIVALPAMVRILNFSALQSPWAALIVVLVVASGLGVATYLRNSHYATTETMWRDIIAKRPNNGRAFCNFGDYLNRQGRFDEAATQYQKAMEVLTPGSDVEVEALNGLAATLGPLGRLDEAEKYCRVLLSRYPNDLEALCNLGAAQLARGDLQAARESFERGLQVDPQCAEAYGGLAEALAGSDPTESLRCMQRAVQLKPDDPRMHLGLGNLIARRDPAAAIPHFESALRLRPDYPEAMFNLSIAWIQSNQLDRAEVVLERLVQIRPTWEEARGNLQAVRKALRER
jgi:tetratricopeptide (TPR) repeat protein